MTVAQGEFLIVNRLGLHARAAAQLVKVASQFVADITLTKDDINVNAKSIMGVLMLAAPQGSTVAVVASGDDAQEALAAVGELIHDGFGED